MKTSTIVCGTLIVLAFFAAALVGLVVFFVGDRIGALLDGERDIGCGLRMSYPGGGAYIVAPDGDVLVPNGKLSRGGASVGQIARVTVAEGDCFIGTIVDRTGTTIAYFTLRPVSEATKASAAGRKSTDFLVREYRSKAEWDEAVKALGILSYRLRRA
jgi:hypothetical protein